MYANNNTYVEHVKLRQTHARTDQLSTTITPLVHERRLIHCAPMYTSRTLIAPVYSRLGFAMPAEVFSILSSVYIKAYNKLWTLHFTT